MNFKTSYIYDLVDKLSPKLSKINNNLKKTASQVKKSASKSVSAFKKFGKSIDTTAKKAKDLGKSLFLKLTLPVGLLGGAFIKAASDAEEISSKFGTVFQNISNEADQTANNLAKNFGLSSVKAKELLGDTGDLLTGFGFTGESALDLSKRVNELAVDLASFTNFSGGAEGASKALTKALLGERESVKSLGISILEEDVKAKIKSLAATGKLTGMTERQAKAYATLEIAVGQSKNAIGDFARTSKGFANQSRILNQRLFDLKVSFGNVILPLATKLVEKLTILSEKFNKLSPANKKLILIIAGLAAVLPPLLIGLGSIIIAVMALLSPIGLVIGGIVGLTATALIFKDEFIAVFEFVSKKIDSIINSIQSRIDSLGNTVGKFAESLGFDFGIGKESELDNILKQQKRELALSSSINVGGTLGINIAAPTGTNANFTPVNNNPMNTNINFTQVNPNL